MWSVADFPLLPDANLDLKWNQSIPPGLGTKYQRARLSGAMKRFYDAAFGDDNPRGITYSPTTLLGNHGRLRQLVQWMVERQIWRFSDITASHILAFCRGLKPRGRGKVISEKSLRAWLQLFQTLWDLRRKYPDALTVDVKRLEDEILMQVKTRTDKPWSALDDDVAFALITDAIAWLDTFGPYILEVTAKAWERFGKSVGFNRKQQLARSLAFYGDLERTTEFRRLKDCLDYAGRAHKILSVALSVTEGACIVLLLLLTGMRVSEVLALDNECLSPESSDGEVLDYIHGPAAKKKGLRRRWVAGHPIPRVIEYLRQLTGKARAQRTCRTKALMLARPLGSPTFVPGRRTSRLTTGPFQKRIRAFACNGLRKGAVQANRFHPHMARKTFAQLAVRRDKRNLEPISAHLGHSYREFTDGKYVGIDHQLAKLLDEQDRIELANGLRHLLTCEGLAGGAAPALAKAREQVRAFPGKRTLERFVDDLISKGVKLAPCDWGFCVYARVHSACDGDERGPNEANRSPDVCSGCQNFAVSHRHRPWWEERALREEAFLKQEDLPNQTRALVSQRLAKTRRILAKSVWLSSATGQRAHDQETS